MLRISRGASFGSSFLVSNGLRSLVLSSRARLVGFGEYGGDGNDPVLGVGGLAAHCVVWGLAELGIFLAFVELEWVLANCSCLFSFSGA